MKCCGAPPGSQIGRRQLSADPLYGGVRGNTCVLNQEVLGTCHCFRRSGLRHPISLLLVVSIYRCTSARSRMVGARHQSRTMAVAVPRYGTRSLPALCAHPRRSHSRFVRPVSFNPRLKSDSPRCFDRYSIHLPQLCLGPRFDAFLDHRLSGAHVS